MDIRKLQRAFNEKCPGQAKFFITNKFVFLASVLVKPYHGQTLAYRTSLGPSFEL
jgi:hypothetical protein